MVAAHGGDARVVDDPRLLPQPGATLEIAAPDAGYVADVDALAIGRVVLQLGGGRTKTDDAIDYAAGVDRLVQSGEHVEKGQPLMRLCAADKDTLARLAPAALAAVRLSGERPAPRELILKGPST
jgi:thymidine phosphorylase